MSKRRFKRWLLELSSFKAAAYLLVASLLFTSACSRMPRDEPLPGVEGYNFTINENESWSGPKIGERIDLTRLKDRNGASLAQVFEGEVAVLALVDPRCGICAKAYDQMRFVNSHARRSGIRYYVASITASSSTPDLKALVPTEFFKYTDSIKVLAPAYLWDVAEGKAPDALYSMSVPSHLLIDRNGTVLRKWLGTDPEEAIRKRMGKQIVLDLKSELAKLSN